MEEIPERQLLVRGRAFATFSAIKNALAGRMRPAGRMLCRPGLRFPCYSVLRFVHWILLTVKTVVFQRQTICDLHWTHIWMRLP